MKIKLDTWAYEPTRAHDTDAGLDIKAPFHFTLYPRRTKVINTGVHVQLPENCVGLLQSKSGLNIKDSILSTGVIDEGYTGEIKVKLYNHGDYPVEFNSGDKISQLIVLPCRYETVEIVDEIEGGERGDQGFGSTGRR